MLTPAQQFEKLLDRYRYTEGLCAPEPDESQLESWVDDPRPPSSRATGEGLRLVRVCGLMRRRGMRW